MKNTPFKFCVELLTPFLILLGYYVISDPHKIIWHYDTFFVKEGANYVDLDHDFVSVQNYDNHRDTYQYNSFIFGNSRSRYYLVDHWKQYLDSSAVCYHMDASNETLKGINLKLKYVDSYSQIDNCLLVLDALILQADQVNKESFIFFPAPQTTPEHDQLSFFMAGFKSFLNPQFLLAYTDISLFGKERGYMKKQNLLNFGIRHYDFRWNESMWPEKEKQIQNGTYYQGQIMDYFPPRNSYIEPYQRCIYEEQEVLLKEIQNIFTANVTDYRIIITTGYDQRAISKDDYEILCSIFGKEHVYDFSGQIDLTDDYHSFYDNGHYRPHIADSIMFRVYNKSIGRE